MPSKYANTRTKDKIKSDRVEVARLYLEGKYQHEIALLQGVSQQQISFDIKAIQASWRDIPHPELTEFRAQELAKIDHLEREYWQAWHDSKKPLEATKQSKQLGTENGSVEKRTASKNGNPAYLQGVERCISARVRILGLDAPVRSEISGVGGEPIQAGLSQVTIDAIKSNILGVSIGTPTLSAAVDN